MYQPFLFQLFFSCNQVQNTTEVVDIIQEANLHPQKAIEICSKIENPSSKQECLFSSSIKAKDTPKIKEKICTKLENKWQSECFFNLAEETDSVEYCLLAKSFEQDCKLHLLAQRSIRHHSMESLIQQATSLALDIKHPNVQSILYRAILTRQKNVPIEQCQSAPDKSACTRVAVMLYQDILKLSERENNFPCSPPLGRLEHQNNEDLVVKFNKFKEKLCSQNSPSN
jgi:hypothetical protein